MSELEKTKGMKAANPKMNMKGPIQQTRQSKPIKCKGNNQYIYKITNVLQNTQQRTKTMST